MAPKVPHVVPMAVVCALACFGARTATAQTVLSIEVLSSRPDLVTGGDALVRVSGPQAPKVTVGASDVSADFRPDQTGRWVGLIEGLRNGTNQLVAKAGGKEATVTLVNHPLNATLFAGPQQEPFICENQSHGLASSADSSCAAPAVVRYFYRNKRGDWKPLDLKGSRPADIAITKTTEGREVPLIVRHSDVAHFSHGCRETKHSSAPCQRCVSKTRSPSSTAIGIKKPAESPWRVSWAGQHTDG